MHWKAACHPAGVQVTLTPHYKGRIPTSSNRTRQRFRLGASGLLGASSTTAASCCRSLERATNAASADAITLHGQSKGSRVEE
jgi:hypothetical protein